MPIITALEVQKNNKNRMNIYIDGKFFCGANITFVLDSKLKNGQEVELDELSHMLFEVEKHDAYSKAMNYVLKSLKTKKQVKEYLQKKGYNNDIIEYVIENLLQIKYLDDGEYAKIYVQESTRKGKQLLKFELRNKGISSEEIEAALEMIEDEESQCMDVAKKYIRGKTLDAKFKQKMIMYLRSKGFDFDTIKSVVNAIYDSIDED